MAKALIDGSMFVLPSKIIGYSHGDFKDNNGDPVNYYTIDCMSQEGVRFSVNFSDNSDESYALGKKLANMLDSRDDQSVAVAVNLHISLVIDTYVNGNKQLQWRVVDLSEHEE